MSNLPIIVLVVVTMCAPCSAQNAGDLEFTDSIQELLIGTWQYQSHETNLAEHLDYAGGIPDFAENKLSRILGVGIDSNLIIGFDGKEDLTSLNNGLSTFYRYSVHANWIWVSKSDYVTTLFYEFDINGNLLLTTKTIVGGTRVHFQNLGGRRSQEGQIKLN